MNPLLQEYLTILFWYIIPCFCAGLIVLFIRFIIKPKDYIYRKVLHIMKNIGISCTEVEPQTVCDFVYLYIEQTYTKKHPRRDSAIKTIQNVCKTLHSNIIDVVQNYNNL